MIQCTPPRCVPDRTGSPRPATTTRSLPTPSARQLLVTPATKRGTARSLPRRNRSPRARGADAFFGRRPRPAFVGNGLGNPASRVGGAAQGRVIRVSPAGNDTQAGDAWSQTKRSVTAAVARLRPETRSGCGRDVRERLTIPDGVALYGGFVGDEAARDQRDWIKQASILDGRQGGVVVLIQNAAGPATRLDGFHVTGGKGIHGGGIRIVGSAPVITHNTIYDNQTDGAGAGVSIWGAQPVTSSSFRSPEISGNLITRNRALNDEGDGGGIAVINSSPRITYNVLLRNEADPQRRRRLLLAFARPFIANNLIQANSASVPTASVRTMALPVWGVGVICVGDGSGRAPDQRRRERAGDRQQRFPGQRRGPGRRALSRGLDPHRPRGCGGAKQHGAGQPRRRDLLVARTVVLENNLVAFNAIGLEQLPTIHTGFTNRFNCVHGNRVQEAARDYVGLDALTGRDGNLGDDPRLADAGLGRWGLQPDSPCVDAGSPAEIPGDWTDFDGQARVQGVRVDIGADESDGTVWDVSTPVFHVRTDGADTGDGLAWSSAKRTVQAAINAAASAGGEVWVAPAPILKACSSRVRLPLWRFRGHRIGPFAARPGAASHHLGRRRQSPGGVERERWLPGQRH